MAGLGTAIHGRDLSKLRTAAPWRAATAGTRLARQGEPRRWCSADAGPAAGDSADRALGSGVRGTPTRRPTTNPRSRPTGHRWRARNRRPPGPFSPGGRRPRCRPRAACGAGVEPPERAGNLLLVGAAHAALCGRGAPRSGFDGSAGAVRRSGALASPAGGRLRQACEGSDYTASGHPPGRQTFEPASSSCASQASSGEQLPRWNGRIPCGSPHGLSSETHTSSSIGHAGT